MSTFDIIAQIFSAIKSITVKPATGGLVPSSGVIGARFGTGDYNSVSGAGLYDTAVEIAKEDGSLSNLDLRCGDQSGFNTRYLVGSDVQAYFDGAGAFWSRVGVIVSGVFNTAPGSDGYPFQSPSATPLMLGVWCDVELGIECRASPAGSILWSGLERGGARTSRIDEDGTITAKTLKLTNVPTANPGVAGAIWSDAGTLKISAG